jgi:predicted XRE-type DNA-binding protein
MSAPGRPEFATPAGWNHEADTAVDAGEVALVAKLDRIIEQCAEAELRQDRLADELATAQSNTVRLNGLRLSLITGLEAYRKAGS